MATSPATTSPRRSFTASPVIGSTGPPVSGLRRRAGSRPPRSSEHRLDRGGQRAQKRKTSNVRTFSIRPPPVSSESPSVAARSLQRPGGGPHGTRQLEDLLTSDPARDRESIEPVGQRAVINANDRPARPDGPLSATYASIGRDLVDGPWVTTVRRSVRERRLRPSARKKWKTSARAPRRAPKVSSAAHRVDLRRIDARLGEADRGATDHRLGDDEQKRVDVDHGGISCAAVNMKVVGQPAPPAPRTSIRRALPTGDPPYRGERWSFSSSSLRPTPVPKQAADVVAAPRGTPTSSPGGRGSPDAGRGPPRSPRPAWRSRGRAPGAASASRRRVRFGGLDLKDMIRFARLLDDESKLLRQCSTYAAASGSRTRCCSGVDSCAGRAADGALEPGPTTRANRAGRNCLHHASVLPRYRSPFRALTVEEAHHEVIAGRIVPLLVMRRLFVAQVDPTM